MHTYMTPQEVSAARFRLETDEIREQMAATPKTDPAYRVLEDKLARAYEKRYGNGVPVQSGGGNIKTNADGQSTMTYAKTTAGGSLGFTSNGEAVSGPSEVRSVLGATVRSGR